MKYGQGGKNKRGRRFVEKIKLERKIKGKHVKQAEILAESQRTNRR
jgi:hypothetical protein